MARRTPASPGGRRRQRVLIGTTSRAFETPDAIGRMLAPAEREVRFEGETIPVRRALRADKFPADTSSLVS